jgi:TatD DNase family protein
MSSPPAGLIDIGANLAHDSFDHDRAEVLQRAWDAGLQAIVVTGSSRDSSLKARELAHKFSPSPSRGEGSGGGATRAMPSLFATAGLHPHHAGDWNAELAALIRELAADPAVVSLGECGLDYFRNYSPHEQQRQAFVAQLEIAADLGKPLFLHQRDAHGDFIAILREFRPRLAAVCVHCFTDTRAALAEYLQLDCHVGITGWICDERRGHTLMETSRDIPDDRLLVETDAPYLLPRTAPRHAVGAASRRNEPCYLPWVVKALAQSRGQSEQHVAGITRDNALRFFRIGT